MLSRRTHSSCLSVDGRFLIFPVSRPHSPFAPLFPSISGRGLKIPRPRTKGTITRTSPDATASFLFTVAQCNVDLAPSTALPTNDCTMPQSRMIRHICAHHSRLDARNHEEGANSRPARRGAEDNSEDDRTNKCSARELVAAEVSRLPISDPVFP
jgi:hypothetical protein